MFRRLAIGAAAIVLSGCNLYPSQPRGAEAAPPALPEPAIVAPVQCPEPEPVICECPEPEKVVVAAPAPACKETKRDIAVLGSVERVEVDETGLIVKARVDTGAKTSSLSARDLVDFERDGKSWVRFQFDPGENAPAVTIEKPVERRVRIKQHDDDSQRRYVVEVRLRVGEIEDIVEVTLSDRSGFEHPILIGRNFLTDNALVDVARQYIAD